MTSSTSINILSNALYDKKEELTDKEYVDAYRVLTAINSTNNNANNANNANNNANNANNNANNADIIDLISTCTGLMFVISIIFLLIGIFIYTTFNRTITHNCKNQVNILNNIIDTCNITYSYFDKNKCNNKLYYCNHITNKMNTYDNLCMPVVSTCFKQRKITKYNNIRICILTYCVIILVCCILFCDWFKSYTRLINNDNRIRR